MARKKVRQSVAVSNKCFRLLRLAHEIQTDVKVLKAVVNEVDVLRLCHSLGMTVSSESNSKHEFEFGMFSASDYDSDFARFIREKLAGGSGCSAQQEEDGEGEELLEIGCLFGKQQQVKAELSRMGFWSSDCEEGLQSQDQGVYCIEGGDEGGNRRQFVVFAWLDAALFKPEAVRDIPAYVLRFLITLSSSITCCLSQEDVRHIKAEVDAVTGASSSRWKSCSVAFRVQKQLEQQDSISCSDIAMVAFPESDHVNSVWFVGGVFPALAVESAAPSTTEWIQQEEIVPRAQVGEWFTKKHENFAVHLPNRPIRPDFIRDDLLHQFSLFPDQELHNLRKKFEDKRVEAKRRIDREATEYAEKICAESVSDAAMLFDVKCPANSTQVDAALGRYQAFLHQLDNCGVLRNMDYSDYKMIYLPDRIQAHMDMLGDVFQNDRLAFEEVLNKVAMDETIDAAKVFWSCGERLQSIWMTEVENLVTMMQVARSEERFQQSSNDREKQLRMEEDDVKQKAFGRFRDHMKSGAGHLTLEVTRMIITADATAVSIAWKEEVEKEPTKVVRVYQIHSDGPGYLSQLGTMEFEPGLKLLKITTVKTGQAVAIVVKEDTTIVRRDQFLLRDSLEVASEQVNVRKFPRACSLCSVRASDRRIAFLFNVSAGRLGKVAFCRFNEAFTSVEVEHNIDMDASFGLTDPLVDILLTERSLCAVDGNGDLQSFDIRTRRTSKKVSCGDHGDNSTWVGGLLSLADELVVGRARVAANQELCVSSISSEDHRTLPTAHLGTVFSSKGLSVGVIGDVLYMVDPYTKSVYASQLSVTVRSDAYRIERSGNAAKNNRRGSLQADKNAKGAAAHWLRVFYHVFEKFPVRSLIDMSMNPDAPFALELDVVVTDEGGCFELSGGRDVCMEYFSNLMVDLRRLNKPLSGLNLSEKLKCRSSEEIGGHSALQIKSIRRALIAMVSFVPVQICRAEDNMLKLLQDGEDSRCSARRDSTTSSEDESSGTGADASEIAQSIRFGLLSPLLESWDGCVVVVTSMGKQSTGKSYFLNHLAGTSFAISGSRCTDGAWMSLRFVSADVLLVVLDFEGLGSFERSEQEDIFLSVLNASVSLFTVFRMESRFDKDIDGLFSRFQKGVQLIKNDPRLFRGLLYMSVKDVNMNDRQGVVDELVAKLDVIFESNKDQNFLTEMYAGQLEINCSPPFGTMDYYQCMESDAARTLCEIVSPPDGAPTGFVTGKSFLDCLRIVLAKISILDWTSIDKSTQNLLVADVKQKIPGILRTGCLVALPLVSDKTIPSHLKEDVLQVGTRRKIVVSMKQLREENPGFASKWAALNGDILLDSIADEDIDLGFDVTMVAGKRGVMVQKMIDMLFQYFLTLLGKSYGTSRLTTEDQNKFDSFAAFVFHRRKLKVERWLRGMLGDHLSEVRAQLEQRYVSPLVLYMARCQHKCSQCQLGCMHSFTHSSEIEHSCCPTMFS
ncbi:hypothetical protein PF008_g16613 [Phytophthora fragariae]|uniref:VLIG-type G domain-containing protein n=1 Tax=Phytophthora fragariae TaxID=53985 RepID=A0A6G0RB61_9STRA|nr:hypothetical protein PF008_g16613 [Phytophthora fragariae]